MSEKQKELITRMIIDYYEFTDKYSKPEYTIGYAEAIMNVIQTILDIDPPGLE